MTSTRTRPAAAQTQPTTENIEVSAGTAAATTVHATTQPETTTGAGAGQPRTGGHELVQVDPATLAVDVNIRHDARLDDDFCASIADHGVLVPIVAVRTADGALRVRFGHRRTLAAVAAGRPTVPVVVAADEAAGPGGSNAAEVERLVTQWAENEHRAGLTTAERADVIGQLSAFGIAPTQIARRTRATRAEVTAALAVTSSQLARAATARYEFLDLAQAAVVADFDADPDAVTALVVAARDGRFDHVAQRLRDERTDRAARTVVADRLRADGVTVIDAPASQDRARELHRLADAEGTRFTETSHAGCPGHAAYVGQEHGWVLVDADGQPTPDSDDGQDDDGEDADEDDAERPGPGERDWRSWPAARWVCTDPAAHCHRDLWASGTSNDRTPAADMTDTQRDAARAARRDVIDSNKAWGSAETVRRDWLRGLATRKTAPKGTAMFVAAALAHDADLLADIGGNHLAADLLGVEAGAYGRSRGLVDLIERAGDARALLLTLVLVLAAYEARTSRDDWRTLRPATGRYLTHLQASGYALADVELRACGQPVPDRTGSGGGEEV
ncbi:chromosome partitioning protein, ParB family [Klenkia marina]|uniref:Chromosome partitioning protein, ParB family n=1 Tax=Klenkia marina TaxID=1960309 RepID=A0A1G4Z494_9ACTN|nr:ParB N-terminal domain-containing protein [Klenkia marina]SCX60492.1 chromosome partitioning protein, ParB family [Klenkia marina]